MSPIYHAGSRSLQDRFDTRRLADRLEAVKVHARFSAEDRAFIESLDQLFLATADEAGHPTCSYKAGDPGFVRVVDQSRLVFPSYDGNGMYLSLGNLLTNPAVGLLFLDFERQRRLRVPHDGHTPPVPAWKRTDWARDVLPAADPARGPIADGGKAGGASTPAC